MRSFITGGEDGYVRLCFFDPEYFTMDETNEQNLRELEELSKKQWRVCSTTHKDDNDNKQSDSSSFTRFTRNRGKQNTNELDDENGATHISQQSIKRMIHKISSLQNRELTHK